MPARSKPLHSGISLYGSTILRQWSRQIYGAGFEGANWPVEFGGSVSYDAVEEMLVTEEFARAKASIPIGSGSLAAHARPAARL